MGVIYTAHVTSRGGREGVVRSSDGHLNLKTTAPKEGAEGTNPEQLFAAGYSACYHSALKSIAKSKNIDAEKSEVTASVQLHKDDDGFKLSVVLEVSVPGLDEKQTMELAEAAHQMCPYSKATRGNIDVELKVGSAQRA
ncbi:organic hydroperoxide resistance protein [Paenibacillus nasutitermitis]|uniref:Organic hydroperoxide resistance protein n=1 Tax=Paenibacillus nasutitermitis TaxID=1652958 RepID=A0A917E072_9BACL|nr:organic hydroperoxide resistance protein [Paenibacillus nasutitermitis]GGD83618.1 organic hydroperoxide resistance protein [Paenibacillus nasutitermitis]